MEKIIEFNEAAAEAATIGKEDIDVWTWTRFFNPNYALSVKARKILERNIIPLYQRYKVRFRHYLALFLFFINNRI